MSAEITARITRREVLGGTVSLLSVLVPVILTTAGIVGSMYGGEFLFPVEENEGWLYEQEGKGGVIGEDGISRGAAIVEVTGILASLVGGLYMTAKGARLGRQIANG